MYRLLALMALMVYGGHAVAADSALARGPIDITAERLDVDQNVRHATFSGNVLVRQGDMTLKTDTVQVTYRQQGEQAIEKVEATGNVTLLMTDTTATGDKAIYLIDSNEIELSGNVVLTRSGNVLTGERLTYNLTTGKMALQAKPRERVSARFSTGADADKTKQGE